MNYTTTMNYPDTNLLDASMPSDSSQSSAESDMELFVDAIEATADEMDYEDDSGRIGTSSPPLPTTQDDYTIDDDSGRTGTSSPPLPTTHFSFSNIRTSELPNLSSSVASGSTVSLSHC